MELRMQYFIGSICVMVLLIGSVESAERVEKNAFFSPEFQGLIGAQPRGVGRIRDSPTLFESDGFFSNIFGGSNPFTRSTFPPLTFSDPTLQLNLLGQGSITTLQGLKDYLKLSDDYSLVEIKRRKTNRKTIKIRMEERFRGVPVYGARIMVEQTLSGVYLEDTLYGIYFRRIEDDITSVTPIIEPEHALDWLQELNDHHNRTRYRISGERTKLAIFFIPPFPTGVLSLRTHYYARPRRNRFTDGTEREGAPGAFMDANVNATIHRQWNGLLSATEEVSIVGVSRNTKAGLKKENFKVLKDPEEEKCFYEKKFNDLRVVVQNRRERIRGTDGAEFNCTAAGEEEYDATNGGYSPLNTAYKWALKTTELFVDVTDDPPTDTDLVIVAHGGPGKDAKWTGSQVILPDGDENEFFPMAEPDIVGHEIGHAYLGAFGVLGSGNPSRSMNEAYCDMVGVTLMSEAIGRPTFEFGATVSKSGKPIRDLCNPTRTDLSSPPGIDHIKDYSSSTDPHSGSGIFGKVFCTLAKKWGIRPAFEMFTYATFEYDDKESIVAVACKTVLAATETNGANSEDVREAFKAVGIEWDKYDAGDRCLKFSSDEGTVVVN